MVDIIIPIYNSELFLNKTIDSVLCQTYTNIHVILVDDCSKDSSAKLCEMYAQKDKRITFIRKKTNTGVSDSRNCALAYMKGTYVMFLDSDDWIDPNTIELTLKCFKKDIDLVFYNYVKEYKTKSQKIKVCSFKNSHHLDKYSTKHYLLRRMYGLNNDELNNPVDCDRLLPVCMKIYKTQIIRENNLRFVDIKNIGTSEDGLFNINYIKNSREAYYLDNYFYHYRRDNLTSITRNLDVNIYIKWNNLYKEMEKSIDKGDEFLYESLNNRIIISAIGYGMSLEKLNCSYIKKRKYLKTFLNNEIYFNNKKNIKLKNFNLMWKIFFFFIKYNMLDVLMIMYKIMNSLTKSKKDV